MYGTSAFDTTRRTFLKIGASTILASLFPHTTIAALCPEQPQHYNLSLYNIHTGESLDACYRKNGKLVHHAVKQISRIMRDYRTGEIKTVDPHLLDLLHRIVRTVKTKRPISIISGYRSPRTNEALRRITSGVARNSFHMSGRAIDIRIPGYPSEKLYRQSIKLRGGGVGFYPQSNFVHLDTGPVRCW
jgi:uncharacterized protein YcbK (DUF882 family)